MSDYEKDLVEEPQEVTTLKEVFSQEYPYSDIKYVDYVPNYNIISQQNIAVQPKIHQESDDVFVYPYEGTKGGNYRLPLLLRGIQNSLPDPENPKNSYVIYPSFDESNKVQTIRILKYPNEILQKIIQKAQGVNITDMKSNTQQRLSTIPTVRHISSTPVEGLMVGTQGFNFGDSSLLWTVTYPEQRYQQIKKEATQKDWGKSTLLSYKNSKGERTILLVS